MTPQEAIAFFESFLKLIPANPYKKSAECSIIALKKQIPKKATEETINRGIDISGEYDIDFNLCCPVCGGIVGTFEGEVDEYFVKYCPNCGQALDWSDAE